MDPTNEPSFRDSVDMMFNRAVALMELPPGITTSEQTAPLSKDHQE